MDRTTTEVAEILGVSRRQVTKLIEQELLRAAKRGRDWFIGEDEIERYQAGRRRPGRPKRG